MLPKISVITPSFNQGQFLEETILSVIGQGYPNLEYIIMDGGSRDDSVEIIKKYERHLAYWTSQKDNGQADAINKGFSRATGDILCWINSDDMYLPGALFHISKVLANRTGPAIAFGNCIQFKEGNANWARGSNVVDDHKLLNLKLIDYIFQPSSFWNRAAVDHVGKLKENLNYAFDWEWFIRAYEQKTEFIPINKFLSLYRYHESHKTGTGGVKRNRELEDMFSLYNSPQELLALKKHLSLKMQVKKRRVIKRVLSNDRLRYFIFFRRLVSFNQYKCISKW